MSVLWTTPALCDFEKIGADIARVSPVTAEALAVFHGARKWPGSFD